jgi:5-methylthioadenosine/S-adenosylhomocysteine deaminase
VVSVIKVIKNGLVITMAENRPLVEKLDIVIEDDTIKELVPDYDGPYDSIEYANKKVIIPGLINGHSHHGMAIFKGINDNLTLDDWLKEKIWPLENKLTEEDIYYSTLFSCIEMIKSGCTCTNEMYINNKATLKAFKDTKIRCLYGYNFMDINGQGDECFKSYKESYNEYKDDPLINFSVAPHSLYTCSKEYLKRCSDYALELGVPVHIHFCENENEVNGIKENYNMDPVDALESVGLLRNKLILAHGTFISDEGLKKLSEHDVSISHNPISNLDLGCGIADITKYKKYVNVCLGTDGVGSCNNLNMFYHMSMVDLLQKGLYKDPTVHSSYETLKMATINGAKALGLEDQIGSIEVGKKADLVVLDMEHTTTLPINDLIVDIVHNVHSNNIHMTVINGDIVYRDNMLYLPFMEMEIRDRVNSILRRLQ